MEAFLTFVAGVVLGGLASWLIAHKYYIRSSADQKREIDRLKEELRPKTTLQDFEKFLVESKWTESCIDSSKVWICDSDNTFQIRVGERSREFNERWTTVHPDSLSGAAYPVYLMIGSIVIKELTFISMDGGRIFVPMAEIRPTGENQVEYFWNLNALEVKVCRVVGSYYIYNDLEGVAGRSRVALVSQ